ncbi:hypothetical protein M438DRAFT_338166 [Aureobasidium pullulans EXF-150]|uniref:Ubiquitin 3 binding protein But2 C-terminal domain-containing protein n=1 Tax=Aureobasidium pullulans EXF-150 TaxID=1043002 RepID=A0A074X7M4_AURPU|nr:uncharacterized protein M438DRAFT_338166 [Aureobasidium pullulans EXF-150]KEQ81393.1 hypothetical protein M438DRAFT_338166 [Aureobasidium pullulans EXF-150]
MILNILSFALTVTLVASQATKPPCADPGLLSGIIAFCGAGGYTANATCQCQNIDQILNAAVPILDALCPADSVAITPDAYYDIACRDSPNAPRPTTIPSALPNPGSLPNCGAGAFSDATKSATTCLPYDFGCMCRNLDSLIVAATPELNSGCSVEDASTSVEVYRRLCVQFQAALTQATGSITLSRSSQMPSSPSSVLQSSSSTSSATSTLFSSSQSSSSSTSSSILAGGSGSTFDSVLVTSTLTSAQTPLASTSTQTSSVSLSTKLSTDLIYATTSKNPVIASESETTKAFTNTSTVTATCTSGCGKPVTTSVRIWSIYTIVTNLVTYCTGSTTLTIDETMTITVTAPTTLTVPCTSTISKEVWVQTTLPTPIAHTSQHAQSAAAVDSSGTLSGVSPPAASAAEGSAVPAHTIVTANCPAQVTVTVTITSTMLQAMDTPSSAPSGARTATTMVTSRTSFVEPAANTSGGKCPLQLINNSYEFPHRLEINGNAGYFGQVSKSDSTCVEFDIPVSYAGKTCTTYFSLPNKQDLKTSSYDLSASPGGKITVTAESSNTVTSFVPAGDKAFKVDSGKCQPGRVSYVMTTPDDVYINWFQDRNDCALGMFVVAS